MCALNVYNTYTQIDKISISDDTGGALMYNIKTDAQVIYFKKYFIYKKKKESDSL